MNKKFGVLVLGFVVVSILVLGFVAAADPIEVIGNQLAKIISPANSLLSYIVGDTAGVGGINSDSIFLSKVLLLILIVCLVSLILQKIPLIADSTAMMWIISIIVGILGIRFLSGDFVAAILLPYATLAVAMSVAIPFIIYATFVYSAIYSPTGRRIAWAFFGLVFFFIWFMRFDDGSLGNVKSLYPLAALLSWAMMFMDGTISRLQKKMAKEKAMSLTTYRHYSDLLKQYDLAEERYTSAIRTGNTKLIKALKTDLTNIDAALTKLKV